MKEGEVIPYEGVGKALHDHPTTVKGENYCYLQDIFYLLTGSKDQHFAFRQSLHDSVVDEQSHATTFIHPT